MELINPKSRLKELILFLLGAPKSHVIAVCVYLNKKYGTTIPTYGSKPDLCQHLSKMDRDELFEAIDVIFEDEDEDDEVEEFDFENEDDETENDQE